MSIALEAIQRFVEPQEVSQPKLVLIVGCLGLASNIVGLFLFHDHGHSHGGHSHGSGDAGHSHGEADDLSHAEQGHAGHMDAADLEAADESGNIADVLPESRLGNWPSTNKARKGAPSEGSDSTAVEDARKSTSSASAHRHHKSKHSRSRSRTYSSLDDLPVNPSSFRRAIIDASRMDNIESGESTDDQAEDNTVDDDDDHHNKRSHDGFGPSSSEQPLLPNRRSNGYGSIQKKNAKSIDHKAHNHAKPKDADKGGHGHSHDLNMRGVFLHVMGDALGNVGVIATALFIWLTDYSWRFYSDPAVSLLITVIILASAIPLCKAASRILLQAVPLGLNIDHVQEDIQLLPGIVSCHHVHVWQLSDTKLVASLHVQVDFDFKGEGSARYMELARAIRDCLHEYGIHSSTIQPEFCLDPQHDHSAPAGDEAHFHANDDVPHGDDAPSGHKTVSKQPSKAGSLRNDADACLLDCGDACGNGKTCCGPAKPSDEADSQDHGHSH